MKWFYGTTDLVVLAPLQILPFVKHLHRSHLPLPRTASSGAPSHLREVQQRIAIALIFLVQHREEVSNVRVAAGRGERSRQGEGKGSGTGIYTRRTR